MLFYVKYAVFALNLDYSRKFHGNLLNWLFFGLSHRLVSRGFFLLWAKTASIYIETPTFVIFLLILKKERCTIALLNAYQVRNVLQNVVILSVIQIRLSVLKTFHQISFCGYFLPLFTGYQLKRLFIDRNVSFCFAFNIIVTFLLTFVLVVIIMNVSMPTN